MRVVAWRSRNDIWHQVEDTDENKIGRYPSAHSVAVAKVIVIAGELMVSPDNGASWERTGETKYLTTHTPFTKFHSIDDFAKASMDYYREKYR